MNEISMTETINQARRLINARDFRGCEKLLRRAMSENPDSAAPHNLMGLLYEKRNDHVGAMKHFRAAWALDPTYKPALRNLDSFGTLFSQNKSFVFDESDYEAAAAARG